MQCLGEGYKLGIKGSLVLLEGKSFSNLLKPAVTADTQYFSPPASSNSILKAMACCYGQCGSPKGGCGNSERVINRSLKCQVLLSKSLNSDAFSFHQTMWKPLVLIC